MLVFYGILPPLPKGCGLPVATIGQSPIAPTEAAAETGDRRMAVEGYI